MSATRVTVTTALDEAAGEVRLAARCTCGVSVERVADRHEPPRVVAHPRHRDARPRREGLPRLGARPRVEVARLVEHLVAVGPRGAKQTRRDHPRLAPHGLAAR